MSYIKQNDISYLWRIPVAIFYLVIAFGVLLICLMMDLIEAAAVGVGFGNNSNAKLKQTPMWLKFGLFGLAKRIIKRGQQ